jgi:hypothetical protein
VIIIIRYLWKFFIKNKSVLYIIFIDKLILKNFFIKFRKEIFINYQDYHKLKQSESIIHLFSDFILISNKYHQIYISRGGKKKYYLTDNFIKAFFVDD